MVGALETWQSKHKLRFSRTHRDKSDTKAHLESSLWECFLQVEMGTFKRSKEKSAHLGGIPILQRFILTRDRSNVWKMHVMDKGTQQPVETRTFRIDGKYLVETNRYGCRSNPPNQ
jgi:hypothetical protein